MSVLSSFSIIENYSFILIACEVLCVVIIFSLPLQNLELTIKWTYAVMQSSKSVVSIANAASIIL
jgi:hypothetical protein